MKKRINLLLHLLLQSTFLILIISCSRADNPVASDISKISKIIDETVVKYVDENDPGIVVAVVYEGKLTHKKGYGMANIAKNLPATPSTPYNICSISKQFTAMAVMICAERELLRYQDKIRNYFPEFPENWDSITIHHLLTHQSGLPDYINELGHHYDGITNDEALHHVITHRTLNFEPGTQFKYCNTGYLLLAELVEKVSGRSFPVFAKQEIFEPLNMGRSLYQDESTPNIPDRAVGYQNGSLHDYNLRVIGDGGVVSTVEDLLKWDRGLYTGLLVSQETLQHGFTGHVDTGSGAYYGYGWVVAPEWRGHSYYSHSGGYRGFGTFNARVPEKDFAVVLFSNGTYRSVVEEVLIKILGYYFPVPSKGGKS